MLRNRRMHPGRKRRPLPGHPVRPESIGAFSADDLDFGVTGQSFGAFVPENNRPVAIEEIDAIVQVVQ